MNINDPNDTWHGEPSEAHEPSRYRADKPPPRIAHYQIDRLLASGALTKLYLAHDENLNRPVTIKLLNTARNPDPECIEAYLSAIGRTTVLKHPNIAPVFGFGKHESFLFVVSQFVEGTDLRERLKQRLLNPSEAAEIIAAIANALQSAHEHGLFHLKLNPQRIVFDDSGKPWLFSRHFVRRELLRGGHEMIVGNPRYLSPEQVEARDGIDGKSDIFTLGLILYEMLTGSPPYKSTGGVELCREILNPIITPPSKRNPVIPAAFDEICDRAIAREPQDRYQEMSSFAEDLSALIQQ
jgi:serine/threonine protein kinase